MRRPIFTDEHEQFRHLSETKTFISNGILANLVIVVARTDPDAGHRGMSLLVVEEGFEGFERGRKLDKIGNRAQDTAELFFRDVRVPAAIRPVRHGRAGQLRGREGGHRLADHDHRPGDG